MADEPATKVRSMVEKLLEADMTEQIAQRSREIAEVVERGERQRHAPCRRGVEGVGAAAPRGREGRASRRARRHEMGPPHLAA